MEDKERVKKILSALKKAYPAAKCALQHNNPFELLVATILSAQTTDKQVNKITPALFKKFKSVEAFAKAPLADIEQAASSVNFFRNKSKSIKGSALKIVHDFGSNVPNTMEQLITLPGVARKTANIILFEGFGINEGIAVDTHVKRLSGRLELSTHSDPVKIEKDLMALCPKKQWGSFSNLLILHGRNVCPAKKPRHDQCVIARYCPSAEA